MTDHFEETSPEASIAALQAEVAELKATAAKTAERLASLEAVVGALLTSRTVVAPADPFKLPENPDMASEALAFGEDEIFEREFTLRSACREFFEPVYESVRTRLAESVRLPEIRTGWGSKKANGEKFATQAGVVPEALLQYNRYSVTDGDNKTDFIISYYPVMTDDIAHHDIPHFEAETHNREKQSLLFKLDADRGEIDNVRLTFDRSVEGENAILSTLKLDSTQHDIAERLLATVPESMNIRPDEYHSRAWSNDTRNAIGINFKDLSISLYCQDNKVHTSTRVTTLFKASNTYVFNPEQAVFLPSEFIEEGQPQSLSIEDFYGILGLIRASIPQKNA